MKVWILLLSLSATLHVHAQVTPPRTAAQQESDADADDDPATDDDEGFDRPEARWHYFYDQRVFPGTQFPEGARLRAFRQLQQREQALRSGRLSVRAAVTSAQWTLIGPRPINYSPGYGTSGRITAIAVDPRNSDVVFIGAADGGVWKTTDGGANWTPLTDDQPSLAIGSLALDPLNPAIVYAGTGEENFNADAYTGVGILKSEDGGNTWSNIVGPFNRQRIGALSVHPSNTSTLLAASNTGIYRSTDAGQSWISVLAGAGTSVFFDPLQPDVAWSALGNISGATQNGVYRSTDAGASWVRISGTAPSAIPSGSNIGRIEVVPALTSPDTVYAAVAGRVTSGASLTGLYRTIDAGAHWTKLSAPDFCNPQCWYNLVIRPHPGNPNVIFAGGVNLYRSIDGGATWNTLPAGGAAGGPHVDHHAMAFTFDGNRFYDANDGGIWSTESLTQGAVVWNNLNGTLALTQYYPSLSIHPTDPNISLAGAQDNGTHLYSGNMRWNRVITGDGGSTAIDPSSPSTAYGSYVDITLYRTRQGNFTDIIPVVHGIDQNDRSRFISAWTMDPSSPQRLYYGTHRLYRSLDGGGLWKAISPDVTNPPSLTTTSSTYTVTTIAIAPANPKVIYTGAASGAVYASEDGGQTWNDRSAGLPTRAITHLTADPLDPATVYATLSGFAPVPTVDAGHVYRSRDNGRSWTDISGNLPNLPVNDLVIDPDIPDALYIATDLGVLSTSDNAANWDTLGSGLPKAAVTTLVLHRATRTLRAATHGRSIWDLALPAGSGAAPGITALTPSTKNAGDPAFTLTITGTNLGFGMHVFWNGEERRVTQSDATSLQVEIPASDLTGAGRAAITVFNPARGGGSSVPARFVIGSPPVVGQGGVVSSAASAIATTAPGALVSVYGLNLATSVTQAVEFPLPDTLGGATVLVNGSPVPVPIYFVSPNQINLQVPFELGTRSYSLTVDLAGTSSASSTFTVARTAPALFSLSQTGAGQGAVRIAGTGILAASTALGFPNSRPAKIGETIEIYCTGLGTVSPSPGTGNAASTRTLATTILTPTVTIGGLAAPVQFSGLAPGAAGLYQVNAKIPDGLTPGDSVPVQLTIGGVGSNTVTVAVAN